MVNLEKAQVMKKYITGDSNRFIPATRYETDKTESALKGLAQRAILEADKLRVDYLDNDVPCTNVSIRRLQRIAAAAETEVILRNLFN